MSQCGFCGEPVEPNGDTTWKQVVGWVGGPKKDSMVMREDTGYHAHDECVKKARAGQAADQPELFDEEAQQAETPHPKGSDVKWWQG